MVSALTTTRLVSAQLALQILQTDTPTSKSTDSSLSSGLGGDLSNLPSQSRASLTNLLNGLSSSQSDTSDSSSSDDPDMTSSDFMSMLKNNLEIAVKNGDSGQAQAMLDAIAKGTLTVSDPTAGQSVTAWDPDAKDETDTTSKDPTKIDTQGWNDFLNAHLKRGSDGAFVKNSDGSYTDKVTGQEAYFGQVGNRFYYISWPAASATTSSGAGAGSTSGGSAASVPATASTGSTNTGA
jgi:hypothetical protein